MDDNYICLKRCSFRGVNYLPGDTIPFDAVLPSRAAALTARKVIAKSAGIGGTPISEQEGTVTMTVPILTKDGTMELTMPPDDVAGAINILQCSADGAVEAIGNVANEDMLILINRLDSRKTVQTAAESRAASLKTDDASRKDGNGGGDA